MSDECGTCDGSGTIVIDSENDNEFVVQRCDDCCKFEDDFEAACSRFRHVRILAGEPFVTNAGNLAHQIAESLEKHAPDHKYAVGEDERFTIQFAIEDFLKINELEIVKK